MSSASPANARRRSRYPPRRGQALLEFAVIAFVFTFLLGAMLTFGFLLFGANVLQQAADVGAMELARLPLPPLIEFPELGDTGRSGTDPSEAASTSHSGANLFANERFRSQIFHERYLVVDLDSDLTSGETLDEYFANAPLLNRLLLPLMVFDKVLMHDDDESQLAERRLVRYPGALVRNTSTGELTVLIPHVTGRDETVGGVVMSSVTGIETEIEWLAVVEEIRDSSGEGPFSLASPATGVGPGMVALRLNYPFQSGAMIAYQHQFEHETFSESLSESLGEDVLNHPVTAQDGNFDPPAPYELVIGPDAAVANFRTHSGRYGLGRLEAYGKQVRPYRKVISAQAIYRREVFE